MTTIPFPEPTVDPLERIAAAAERQAEAAEDSASHLYSIEKRLDELCRLGDELGDIVDHAAEQTQWLVEAVKELAHGDRHNLYQGLLASAQQIAAHTDHIADQAQVIAQTEIRRLEQGEPAVSARTGVPPALLIEQQVGRIVTSKAKGYKPANTLQRALDALVGHVIDGRTTRHDVLSALIPAAKLAGVAKPDVDAAVAAFDQKVGRP
ncbi:MAG: hypothetical protein IPM45_04990 [Acidimicrobiales bacterium]|nr:hypothetical protein [Acidimicrobiales bacterium]